jgi:menaquinone-dependent protoporphyrinogen oxidase
MASILYIYSTTDGQTRRICEKLQHVAHTHSHTTRLIPIQDVQSLDLSPFDTIVVGASIRYGKHSPLVFDFFNTHAALLATKPNVFFTVNVVARKPAKNQPSTNPYMVKLLQKIPVKPTMLGVFAGKINYPALGPMDRNVIRFIMWMTKGPTDPTGTFEFTDWQQVEAFGEQISALPVKPQ